MICPHCGEPCASLEEYADHAHDFHQVLAEQANDEWDAGRIAQRKELVAARAKASAPAAAAPAVRVIEKPAEGKTVRLRAPVEPAGTGHPHPCGMCGKTWDHTLIGCRIAGRSLNCRDCSRTAGEKGNATKRAGQSATDAPPAPPADPVTPRPPAPSPTPPTPAPPAAPAPRKEPPMARTCSRCGKSGHNSQTCTSTKKNGTEVATRPAKESPAPAAAPVAVAAALKAVGNGLDLESLRKAQELCEQRAEQYAESARNLKALLLLETALAGAAT